VVVSRLAGSLRGLAALASGAWWRTGGQRIAGCSGRWGAGPRECRRPVHGPVL